MAINHSPQNLQNGVMPAQAGIHWHRKMSQFPFSTFCVAHAPNDRPISRATP